MIQEQAKNFSDANLGTHESLNTTFNLEMATEFCQNLPTHHIAETAKKLYDFFICFNQQQIDSTVRQKITRALMIKIDYIYDSVFKQYFFCLSDDLKTKKQIVILIKKIFSLAKENYNIIIFQQSNKWFVKKEILAESISYCLKMNLKLFFIHFLIYAKPPKNLWLECHSLYQLAEKNQVLQKKISAIDKEIAHSCVADWYKHLLLFSITNPYRLCSKELLLLYHALSFWTKYLKITKTETGQEELFNLHLNQDSPPTYASLSLFPICGHTRTLVLKKVTHHLDGLENEMNHPSPTEKNLPKHLIKQLLSTWSYFSNRGQDRIELMQPAKIFTGLHSIIEALAIQEFTSPPTQKIIDCIIINESPGGVCIEFNTDAPSHINIPQTGELLGISIVLGKNEPQFSIGVIRWAKQLDASKTQCGVQLLGHHPLSLTIQIVGDNEQELIGEPQKVLFVPEVPIFGRNESIISPSLPFKPGMKLKLIPSSSTEKILDLHINTFLSLSNVVLSSDSFKQFSIQTP